MAYKRILLIGSPGSGKSTMAPKLAEQFNVPLYHLDHLNWINDNQTVSKQIFLERLEGVVSGDCWLIDGNYASSLPLRLQRADLVIWVKVPRLVCMYRVIKRFLKHFGRPHPAGNPNRLDWEFLKFVWHFPKSEAQTEALLASYPRVTVYRIQNLEELREKRLLT